MEKSKQIAVIAAVAGIALLVLRKPVSAAVGAVVNTGQATSAAWYDGVSEIGEWLKNDVLWKGLPTEERRWEVNYKRYPNGAWHLGSMLGDKPFKWPADRHVGDVKLLFNPPGGDIKITGSTGSRQGRGSCGLLTPSGYSLRYLGKPSILGAISGDPRALYCLDQLMRVSGVKELDHQGIVNWNPSNGYLGHDDGCAIDIMAQNNGHAEMNKIIEAAKLMRMPIAWVSTHRDPGTKKWPIFQLRNGVKERVDWTGVDHSSHYHVLLPRPQGALVYCK